MSEVRHVINGREYRGVTYWRYNTIPPRQEGMTYERAKELDEQYQRYVQFYRNVAHLTKPTNSYSHWGLH